MQKTVTACLVMVALGVVTGDARADEVAQTWSPPGPEAAREVPEEPAAGDRGDDDSDPPMRSGWGFAGGVVLTAVGGSFLVGAALSTLPIGYEGNGGGDPGPEVATIAVL